MPRGPVTKLSVVLTAVFCSAMLTTVSAAASSRPAAGDDRSAGSVGTWGRALEVPGSAALNKGGGALIEWVSCASAGNCEAAGYYTDSHQRIQAFIVGETKGRWGTATEVPGTAVLNKGGDAVIHSVSCASAGNCSAGGYFTDRGGISEALVVNERDGRWGPAEEVPGIARLNTIGLATVLSVSCASAGNCTADGVYDLGSAPSSAPFVVSEKNGTWRTAAQIPGIAALNKGGYADVGPVSCVSAGNCAAGGTYLDGHGHEQAFVASQMNGIWGTAQQIPGVAALNKGEFAVADVVSCGSRGNCGVSGSYRDGEGHYQAFVASEKNGIWGNAQEVPGTAGLNQGGIAGLGLLSCLSPGNCDASGTYTDGRGRQQAFVVSERNGIWARAQEIPGTAALNQGDAAGTESLSCAAPGDCSAGGSYTDRSGRDQAFVVSERNGTWGRAEEVPGTAALNKGGGADVGSVSCVSASICAAGGNYADKSGHLQAFVVSEN